MLKNFSQSAEDYQRIERAIRYLQANLRERPALARIARHVHLSEFHFQRLFKRWAGISPKQFVQYFTLGQAKQTLRGSRSLLDAAYETGLSGPGRLHDLFVSLEAVTPGEYKNQGKGLTIHYGFHPSPFGECLLAITRRGICGLFFAARDRTEGLRRLKKEWPGAVFKENQKKTRPILARIFAPSKNKKASPLRLFVKGTNFQIKVWEALLEIPAGEVRSYEEIAKSVGKPKAARAIGNAVGANPVAYLIPCHRVIQATGLPGNYRWGALRKQALLMREFPCSGG